jgi:hypothetical protein
MRVPLPDSSAVEPSGFQMRIAAWPAEARHLEEAVAADPGVDVAEPPNALRYELPCIGLLHQQVRVAECVPLLEPHSGKRLSARARDDVVGDLLGRPGSVQVDEIRDPTHPLPLVRRVPTRAYDMARARRAPASRSPRDRILPAARHADRRSPRAPRRQRPGIVSVRSRSLLGRAGATSRPTTASAGGWRRSGPVAGHGDSPVCELERPDETLAIVRMDSLRCDGVGSASRLCRVAVVVDLARDPGAELGRDRRRHADAGGSPEIETGSAGTTAAPRSATSASISWWASSANAPLISSSSRIPTRRRAGRLVRQDRKTPVHLHRVRRHDVRREPVGDRLGNSASPDAVGPKTTSTRAPRFTASRGRSTRRGVAGVTQADVEPGRRIRPARRPPPTSDSPAPASEVMSVRALHPGHRPPPHTSSLTRKHTCPYGFVPIIPQARSRQAATASLGPSAWSMALTIRPGRGLRHSGAREVDGGVPRVCRRQQRVGATRAPTSTSTRPTRSAFRPAAARWTTSKRRSIRSLDVLGTWAAARASVRRAASRRRRERAVSDRLDDAERPRKSSRSRPGIHDDVGAEREVGDSSRRRSTSARYRPASVRRIALRMRVDPTGRQVTCSHTASHRRSPRSPARGSPEGS